MTAVCRKHDTLFLFSAEASPKRKQPRRKILRSRPILKNAGHRMEDGLSGVKADRISGHA